MSRSSRTAAGASRGGHLSTIEIRPEGPDDITDIRQVHLRAFDPSPMEADLVDLLRGAGKALISLVAVGEGRIVGHVLFSPVEILPSPSTSLRGLGLAPVGVLPAFQRQGVGSQLIERGLSDSRESGADFVVVLGNPAYYSRFGFIRARAHGLGNEYGADEAFRVIELRAGCLRDVQGSVQYAPEFRELGA